MDNADKKSDGAQKQPRTLLSVAHGTVAHIQEYINNGHGGELMNPKRAARILTKTTRPGVLELLLQVS